MAKGNVAKTPKKPRKQGEDLVNVMNEALQDQEVPKIYFNGFINAIGTGDITLILRRNNQPVAVVNTSYTMAKTLSKKLGSLIADLEQRSGNTIMTSDDINTTLSKE